VTEAEIRADERRRIIEELRDLGSWGAVAAAALAGRDDFPATFASGDRRDTHRGPG
jgi:hypothetical protein